MGQELPEQGEDIIGAKGLTQHSIRPGAAGMNQRVLHKRGGGQNDRDMLGLRVIFQVLTNFDTRHRWQQFIDQNDAGLIDPCHFQPLITVCRAKYLISRAGEHHLQQQHNAVVTIND